MSRLIVKAMALVVVLVCCSPLAAAAPIAGAESNPPLLASSERFLLGPPMEAGPVVVRARFELCDINERVFSLASG